MTKIKDVKILFHTLIKVMYRKEGETISKENPLYEIDKIIEYILKIKKINRFKDLKDNKFCFLEISKVEVLDANVKLITCLFKSARNEFRPNLINKKTGDERANPKALTEGDIEKTHLIIKIDKNAQEVYLLVEYNYHGATINNIISYLKDFNRKYLESNNMKIDYLINYKTIVRNDFLTELERFTRSKIAEVYFSKKLLGSNALNFSDKTISLKKELKLVASAEIGESITEVVLDFYNKLQSGESEISKVRVTGKDSDDNEIIIDTSFLSKKEFLKADLNYETGEVNSTQMFTNLKQIAISF